LTKEWSKEFLKGERATGMTENAIGGQIGQM
jgi:hypothetical protein